MRNICITILLVLINSLTYADGIIIADNENYPGRILKNKSTNVEVNIEGLIARTITTQEFQNEWNQEINGVYSFPLPLNARATRLMYSKGDTLIDAVLRVMPQSTTPGTGEGGLVAEINQYMGQNVIRLRLNNIIPNAIKWIKLEYIMELNHFEGEISYTYPLDTKGFYTIPLDYLSVNINVHSSQMITDFDIPSHPGYTTIASSDHNLNLILIKPNAFQAQDIKFIYTVENPELVVDFYSQDTDTTNGYFTLVGRPLLSPTGHILPTNIVFLIENSTTMIGEKLDQSKLAVIQSLDHLSIKDSFNIIYFNYSPHLWQSALVEANPDNIANAKAFVENISATGGSNIGNALHYSLQQVENTTTTSSILVFTDGKGYVDPYAVENYNTNKTGIFFIAFTDKVDRHRLETTARLNYGSVTYLNENSVLSSEMLKIFKKINRPLIKDVNISFSAGNVYDLYPSKFPAIYGDSDFKITGRYTTPGSSIITISGIEETGNSSYSFEVILNPANQGDAIARSLWGKDAILDIESVILINGETEALKNELINLSLFEKMRSRYTAYVEDEEYSSFSDSIFFINNPTPFTGFVNFTDVLKVYPNPVFEHFTVETDMTYYKTATDKRIKIYDILGNLLFTYDIGNDNKSTFTKTFNRSVLPTATSLVLISLEINGKTIGSKTVVVSK